MSADGTAQPSSTPAGRSPGSTLAVVVGLFAVVTVVATAFISLVLGFALEIPSSPVPLIAISVVPQLLFLVVGYLWMTRQLNRLPVAMPSIRQVEVVVAGIIGGVRRSTSVRSRAVNARNRRRTDRFDPLGPAEHVSEKGHLRCSSKSESEVQRSRISREQC